MTIGGILFRYVCSTEILLLEFTLKHRISNHLTYEWKRTVTQRKISRQKEKSHQHLLNNPNFQDASTHSTGLLLQLISSTQWDGSQWKAKKLRLTLIPDIQTPMQDVVGRSRAHTYIYTDRLHLHVCADAQSAQAVCTRQRPKLILRHDDEQPGEFSSLSMINCRFINGRSDESLLARWACMILQTLHLSADIISADVGKLPDDDATRW